MYIWFILGHRAATGGMHVYICVWDVIWKYHEKIVSRSFRTSTSRPGMLGAMYLLYCMIAEHSGLFLLWLQAQYNLKLKKLQYLGLSN